VQLAVPWRGEIVDPSGQDPPTDGPASAAMVLEAFGINVQTSDLIALAQEWQPTWSPSEPLRFTTLTRIGGRGSLRPQGPVYGTGGDEWTPELARDYLRRGYPIVALLHPSFLPGEPSDANRPDRYVVLIGYDGDEFLYHDPTVPAATGRRISSARLEAAWANAVPPRDGAAFGYGSSVSSLVSVIPKPVPPTATPVPPLPVPTSALAPLPTPAPQATVAPMQLGVFGPMHPALVGLFSLLGALLGFAIFRLAR
jgi:hypothetical protein